MRDAIPITALSIAATAGFAVPVAASAPPKAKRVRYCLTFEPGTGTRIHRTECMTESEWIERRINGDEHRRG